MDHLLSFIGGLCALVGMAAMALSAALERRREPEQAPNPIQVIYGPPASPGPAREAPTSPGTVPVESTVPGTVPSTVPASDTKPARDPAAMLHTFCCGIRDMEGKPGDLSYRNNNPGNFRCSPAGYLAKYGNVRCVGNFAVFPTWELGWEYLQESVKARAKKHPTWTIFTFFAGELQPDGKRRGGYAPTGDDNDPAHYAATVAARCGVPVTTTLRELFLV